MWNSTGICLEATDQDTTGLHLFFPDNKNYEYSKKKVVSLRVWTTSWMQYTYAFPLITQYTRQSSSMNAIHATVTDTVINGRTQTFSWCHTRNFLLKMTQHRQWTMLDVRHALSISTSTITTSYRYCDSKCRCKQFTGICAAEGHKLTYSNGH